ncbi:MAG: DUF4338 domain-containing protein [Thermoanaerobaculales bacterium]|nr:DUF4338 domain-containing protein [Thermoanaerobaculales bacterium]
MDATQTQPLVFKGRTFTPSDLRLIQEIVDTYGNLGRQELAQTIAELLEWERPNGSSKWRECRDLLNRLADEGFVALPELRSGRPRGSKTSVPLSADGEPGQELLGSVGDVAPVKLILVRKKDDRLLWRELVGRYHYLGHKVPFGAQLRYLISVSRPSQAVVGCIQISSPAWKLAPRDTWVGWNAKTREQNLQMIVNNSRFLILPWVKVKNLASHVLAKLTRELIPHWQEAYGIAPVLMETFVDSRRFRGTCYKAANWTWLGTTQGRGRMDRQKQRIGVDPKEIFIHPLVRGARRRLCGDG